MSADDRSVAELFGSLCDESILLEEMARLNRLLCGDAAVRRQYVEYLDLHARLSWQFHRPLESMVPLAAGDGETQPTGAGAAVPAIIRTSPSFAPSFFSLESPLGNFLFSYVAATVIVGVGILIAWMCHVSDPRANAPAVAVSGASSAVAKADAPAPLEPEVVSVACVTGMVDCTWANAKLAPSMQRVLLGDKFAMASGLMEITYDTGAKVILQGLCTYTVESKTGGYLARGKLMARVDKKGAGNPKSQIPNQHIERLAEQAPPLHGSSPDPRPQSPAPLFSVRTPTAVVNDLGTEFGVEVNENSDSSVHVFSGAVDLIPAGKPASAVRMAPGEARRVSAARDGAAEKIGFNRDGFAKPLAMLEGKFKRDAILFHDAFKTFALGTRWRATDEGPPDGVLQAATDNGRPSLRMEIRPAGFDLHSRGIETIDSFPLRDLAAIQLDVVFRTSEDAPPQLQVWILGSSKKMARILLEQHLQRRITLNASTLNDPKEFVRLADQHSPEEVYQNGERYRYRAILSVTRRGAALVVRDDVNLSVVYRTSLDNFTLADLGDDARIVLRLRRPLDHPGGCWIYGVTVRGRPSATRYPSSTNAARHTSPSATVKPLAASH
jgi:hypothetical protein